MPKIQSDTPKKGRKSNRQLIKELGAYLIDSGQSVRLDDHFQTTIQMEFSLSLGTSTELEAIPKEEY